MKKTVTILFACIFLSFAAKSQITKGNWMIGGSVSYSSTVYKSEAGDQSTDYVLQITPDIGYFFWDKAALGLKSNIRKSGVKPTGTRQGYNRHANFNIGPFARYYVLNKEKIINLLIEGAYQYGFNASGLGETRNSISKNAFEISAGPVAFFNSAVGLELLIGYSSSKIANYKGRNGTVNFNLGLQVYLEKAN